MDISLHRPKTIYLANTYGFSAQQKEMLLPAIIEALESLGLEVWEPSHAITRRT